MFQVDPQTYESSYELAKASSCVSGAIQPCDIYQSFVWEDALRKWASNQAVEPRTQPSSASGPCRSDLYESLENAYDFRVIELRPGSGTSSIDTILHHCSLEFDSVFKNEDNGSLHEVRYATSLRTFGEPIWYTALSYTWGPPIFDKTISVGERELSITTSLYTALLHLRHPEHSVMLWIDQICINQSSNAEKEQQIPLMSRIYTHALNTIIWLGLPLRPESSPFDALQRCAINLYLCNDIDCPQDFGRLGLPAPESEEWVDIWDVLSRQWFTRVVRTTSLQLFLAGLPLGTLQAFVSYWIFSDTSRDHVLRNTNPKPIKVDHAGIGSVP